MYNTNYKCVKPFDVWLDAIGPDGKKIPYRVERGTIWRLVWSGAVASRASRNSPDRIRCTLHCQMSVLRNTSRNSGKDSSSFMWGRNYHTLLSVAKLVY